MTEKLDLHSLKMNMHEVYHTTLSQVTGYNIMKNERVYKLCVSPAMPVSSP